MVAPVILPASVASLNGFGTTVGSMSVGLLGAGNDRILVIVCLAKDNTSPAALVSTITVDSGGVNRTIGAGVTRQGAFQIAQEGTFSSQCDVYFCLEADLPISGGFYSIDIAMDSAPQYNMWVAFEVTGCPKQVFDNLVQNSSTVDKGANVLFSEDITPVDSDCLIVDFWSTSHSNQPTYTTGQTLVASSANANGAFLTSQFTQVGAATLKSMTLQASTLSQRGAWNLISFSGLSGVAPIGIPILRRRLMMRNEE